MRNLHELQLHCRELGLVVPPQRRSAKEPYLNALRDHLWAREHPDKPLPEQIEPMLLGDWNDLAESDTAIIAGDDSGWCVQPKEDG